MIKRFTREFYKTGNVIQSNIQEIWDQRTYQDYNEGIKWYREANKFSLELSEKYKVTPVITAGVISSLSPQKSWEENKIIVEHFFQRVEKAPITGWRSAKHYLTQKRKAWRIYRTRDIPNGQTDKIVAEELHGKKTVNFFYCINNPDNNEYLCIDRHNILAALGHTKSKLTPKQYEFLKSEYIKFAKSVNMKPLELQGVLWLTVRRIKKI